MNRGSESGECPFQFCAHLAPVMLFVMAHMYLVYKDVISCILTIYAGGLTKVIPQLTMIFLQWRNFKTSYFWCYLVPESLRPEGKNAGF